MRIEFSIVIISQLFKMSYPFLFAFLVLHEVIIALSFVVVVFVQAFHASFFLQSARVHVFGGFLGLEFIVKVLGC